MVIAIKDNGDYQVKLHFMEPEDIGLGKRVFDVALQGEIVLRELDITRVAGGYRKAIVKEFDVTVRDQSLRIGLSPKSEQPAVLCGIEWHEKP